MTNLDPKAFADRVLALRISLHPGFRVEPSAEDGLLVEIPVWFARRKGLMVSADTPIEAVDKLVQRIGGTSAPDIEAGNSLRSSDPRGGLADSGA